MAGKRVREESTNQTSSQNNEQEESKDTTLEQQKTETIKVKRQRTKKQATQIEEDTTPKITFVSYLASRLLYILGLDFIITNDTLGNVFIDCAKLDGRPVPAHFCVPLHGHFTLQDNEERLENFMFNFTTINIHLDESLSYPLPFSVKIRKTHLEFRVLISYKGQGFFTSTSRCMLDQVKNINLCEQDFFSKLSLYKVTLANYKNSEFHVRDETQQRITCVMNHFQAIQIRTESWHFPTLIHFLSIIPNYYEIFKYDEKHYFMSFLSRALNKNTTNLQILNERAKTYDDDKAFYFLLRKDKYAIVKMLHDNLNNSISQNVFLKTSLEEVVFPNLNRDIIYHLATLSSSKHISIPELPICLNNAHLKKYVPIIFKPNGVIKFGLFCDIIKQRNLEASFEIDKSYLFKYSNDMVAHFYENCANRPYGADWYSYLQSGDSLLVWIKCSNYKEVRSLALEMRVKSQEEFTRNVNHTAENDKEEVVFKEFVSKFFPTYTASTNNE